MLLLAEAALETELLPRCLAALSLSANGGALQVSMSSRVPSKQTQDHLKYQLVMVGVQRVIILHPA